MKQKRLDTLGLPEDLVARKRFSSARQNRASANLVPFFSPKMVAWLVLAAVLAVMAWYLPKYIYKKTVVSHSGNGRVTLPTTQLPNGFPPELPFIDAKTVLHNFTSDLSGGPAQGVRKWKVSKSVSDIGSAYESYFRANGWEITTTLKTGEKVLLAAVKAGKILSVSVQTSPEAGASLVEASVRMQEDKNSSN